jgi:septum formation protein
LIKQILPLDRIIFADSGVEERRRSGEPVESFSLRMAKDKATTAWHNYHGPEKISAVIGADTVVLFRDRIIGQPEDSEHAMRILKMLSGECHEVITGVALLHPASGQTTEFVVRSKVWMHELSTEVIEDYVRTGEPLDKAGAYAIQGKGGRFVARYEGSYTNIIGLPVDELKEALGLL